MKQPGEDLVAKGLTDLEAGARTAEALLVAIGAPRLRFCEIDIPSSLPEEPELGLYLLLAETWPDPHSRYNSLIRQLISYEQALERRLGERLRRLVSAVV